MFVEGIVSKDGGFDFIKSTILAHNPFHKHELAL